MAEWKFLTNHAHVLLCVMHEPDIRLREIADAVGITERAAHRIIAELEDDGYISRERRGRRNLYRLHSDAIMGHPDLRSPLLGDRALGELLAPLIGPPVAVKGMASSVNGHRAGAEARTRG